MKTINLDLAKRLAPYIDIETEYVTTDFGNIYESSGIEIIDTSDKNSAMYGHGKSYRKFSKNSYPVCLSSDKHYDSKIFKTLTLEEAIEFLPLSLNLSVPKNIQQKWKYNESGTDIKLYTLLNFGKNKQGNYVRYQYGESHTNEISIVNYTFLHFNGGAQLEVIEKMLEYLLDNNLLGHTKKN